jgi:hypothetical protein
MRVTTASVEALVGEPTASLCLVSVVIPCLNEAENIKQCAALAETAGARVVHEPRRG